MAANDPQLRIGDVGKLIRVKILDQGGEALDISDVTVKTFIIKRKNNTFIEVTPDFFTDGTDGYLVHHTIEADLTIKGTYQIQAYIEYSTGKSHTTIGSFEVAENLTPPE